MFGVFSGHAVYLPELFPTHVRATAVSFCNGTGRIITSFGPLLAGLLVGVMQPQNATAGMTCFALLSILAMVPRPRNPLRRIAALEHAPTD